MPGMEAERPAKRARLGENYYKQIDGVQYDRELLEKAEAFAKDGQVSYPEAKELWEEVQDGPGVTEIEKLTLEYTLKTLKYSEKAANYIKVCMTEPAKSYYKQIDGVKYDAQLLQKAEDFAKDGQISFPEAKALLEEAQDGKGMTQIEKQTLEYTLKNLKYTDKAASFMKESIMGPTKSYYKQIDGVKYDRELLEMAEAFAKDGQVSYPEAKKLLDATYDGKGITEIEKQTLEYTLKNLKYSDKAANFMTVSLKEPPKSYYKQIDGVQYDAVLLQQAEEFAKDGQISADDAAKLWEETQDGPGVTEIERKTLEYTLKNLKYTDKAAEFLKGKLAA